MIHELKTEQLFFDDIANGTKNFEVRINDRPYKVGDYLALNEWEDNRYTGRTILVKITYILVNKYCKEGYITMAIHPCTISEKETKTSAPIYGNYREMDDCKLIKSHGIPHQTNGKCDGFAQKWEDDEPCETCKNCKSNTFYEKSQIRNEVKP